MCIDCDEWKLRGIARRDFRATKGGPEELPHRPKNKKKRWCRGKEGVEHRYERAVWYSYDYVDGLGNARVRDIYRWICQGCSKVSWAPPARQVSKHDHCFCITETAERWRREEIWEQCCVCGGKGKSYSFYRQR